MTLTDRSMEWLDQNRHRSYPFRRDEWRKMVSAQSGLDCVVLDAMVFDADARGGESLSVESIAIEDSSTVVDMEYAGRTFSVTLSGGESSGARSFEVVRGVIQGTGLRGASISIVFSSHRYILDAAGRGMWNIGCKMLSSRVANLSDGVGVDGVASNGSKGVVGHEAASVASGDVVLEDGYRTSPVVWNGEVLVRVGRRFGHDPCRYYFEESDSMDCRRPMFFFCGQNAVNSGNVAIKGGPGISVKQGRSYKVKSGTCAGKTIPCIEIVATQELLDLFAPVGQTSGQSD